MILQRAIVLGVLFQYLFASGACPTTAAPARPSPRPKAQGPTPKARCQTSDSPTPGAHGLTPDAATPARPIAFADDRRLDAPVRVEMNGVPVAEILAGLEKQSSVQLESGAGMAELKAVVLAKGVS